ncbi:hypothetical protein E2C01_053308 [Portunus trituberculatus]|uniref:Uncharacterized protein n=1 Tax=Portunus trituberculatus TaxID=210409 RepID=A0A5B7GJY9_PORTR|nr:hypothetical protein [Portunus trituberculatus]
MHGGERKRTVRKVHVPAGENGKEGTVVKVNAEGEGRRERAVGKVSSERPIKSKPQSHRKQYPSLARSSGGRTWVAQVGVQNQQIWCPVSAAMNNTPMRATNT